MLRRLHSNNGGFILVFAIIAIGLVAALLASYFSIVSGEISSVHRATGRVQAFYLAEAGIDAASDIINQDWDDHQRASVFPFSETLTVPLDEDTNITIGDYTVTATELSPNTLQLTSTGRSLPLPAIGGETQYGVSRTISIVLLRRQRPAYRRVGQPGYLDLEVNHFNENGSPDLLTTSGTLVDSPGQGRGNGILTSGGADARAVGYHIAASFSDVDLDGDMDLILSDAPSQQEPRGAPFIPTTDLTDDEDQLRPYTATTVDPFGSGQTIPFVAQGWLWLPNDSLTGREPSSDIFINYVQYDDPMIVSWAEH